MSTNVRLGVNIDHVATLRNARDESYPDPLEAAKIAVKNGAEVITFHLREDRRHIKDSDVKNICKFFSNSNIVTNFEMAATEEMKQIAIQNSPDFVCLVPEKRHELTTEGGLNILFMNLEGYINELQNHSIKVSLFLEPCLEQIKKAADLSVDAIELHTGRYANSKEIECQNSEINKLQNAAKFAHKLGLKVYGGHGLNFNNINKVLTIEEIEEFNIGHALISESIFQGIGKVVSDMKNLIDENSK